MWSCGDVDVWRCGCGDVEMEMCRCEDVEMWKFGVIDAAKLCLWLVEVLRYKTNSQLML